ncbi:serine protease [Lysinibacter sp. HNR]|uniref:S1 family peptidase n=1 Tax=Lysinibacter sp. HNR TaxID=3031408 RepID=UPI0024350E94|nr:serine protease [Lysinibacter sp. HNR]WGD37521.1 serine protease [Lysinibacter sp. HNR]
MRKQLVVGLASVAITLLALTAGAVGAQAQGIEHDGGDTGGNSDVPYVIGGGDARKGEFPFVASVQNKGKHECTGSLISSGSVLTAYHCVREPMDVANLTVVVGRNDLNDKSSGHVRKVELIFADDKNDTAVLYLDKSIDDIYPVKFPTPGTDALLRPGSLATLAGWGNIDPHLPHDPSILQKVQVPLLSQNECAAAWEHVSGMFTDKNICAGRAGIGSCYGDSGGPLFKKIGSDFYQIGVVSRGGGTCAQPGEPGIYASTSVTSFLEDMEQVYPKPEPVTAADS